MNRVLALREGGQTLRVHTMPHNSVYNVAIHSYNMLNMLLVLYPTTPSINLVKAIMWHDVPERWTGDVPAPAKWASTELKKILDLLEFQVLEKLGLAQPFKDLTPSEQEWLKAIDLLELHIWAMEQQQAGNPNAHAMMSRIFAIFERDWERMPVEVRIFIRDLKWERTVECDELLNG